MKNVVFAIFIGMIITGCGGSGDSVEAPNTTSSGQTDTTTSGDSNNGGTQTGGGSGSGSGSDAEVHWINPADVPAYVEKFKARFDKLNFQLEGQQYSVEFVEVDEQNSTLILSFAQGLIFLGFEAGSESPSGELTIHLGDISNIGQVWDNPDAKLIKQSATVSADGDSHLIEASLINEQDQMTHSVRFVYNDTVIEAGYSRFEVEGNRAMLSGALGTNSYIQLKALIADNPSLDTIVLKNIDGSVNDAMNLHTARLAREAKLTTLMPADGEAYSGGVDFYLAGYKRVYEPGGKLGVHSWCCVDGKGASELGRDHPEHGPQLTFVREMMGDPLGPDFYFFTLEAAPHDGIHLMSAAEIEQYFSPSK